MPEPIVETCRNPAETRRRAIAGDPLVPCYRCLAYRPETETGCHFLEVRPGPVKTSPLRAKPTQQQKLW